MSSFDTVLYKKMNRQEFLVYLGLFLLTLTGIGNLLNSLKNNLSKSSLKAVSKTPFSLGVYGGTKKGES